MASFDSNEDLAITKAWYAETRFRRQSSVRVDFVTFWVRVHTKFGQEFGNPNARSVQQVHDRHLVLENAILAFLSLQPRIFNTRPFTLSIAQFNEVVKAKYLEEKGETFVFDASYHFLLVVQIYDFLLNLVNEQIGGLSGNVKQKFFPRILVTFTFSLFRNLHGMIPYSFTVTSHFLVTLGLSFSIFIGITIVGFQRNGIHFPEDNPDYLDAVSSSEEED